MIADSALDLDLLKFGKAVCDVIFSAGDLLHRVAEVAERSIPSHLGSNSHFESENGLAKSELHQHYLATNPVELVSEQTAHAFPIPASSLESTIY
jgi:hypothetical protein